MDSKASFGKVGKVPYSNVMPDGSWIVYHTDDDHFMFPVQYNSHDVSFTVIAEKCATVEILQTSEVIQQVSLFRDKNERWHMKEVKVTSKSVSDIKVELKFEHKNEILNKILSRREAT